MALNEMPHLMRSVTDVAAETELGADRSFGFLVHDVAHLIKRPSTGGAGKPGYRLPGGRRQSRCNRPQRRCQSKRSRDLARMEPIVLVRMLDKLHEEGLVERRPHPTDRRIRTLWLTPAARPVIERILIINHAIREEAFAGLPARARNTVVNIPDGIKDNLALQEEAADSSAAVATEVV